MSSVFGGSSDTAKRGTSAFDRIADADPSEGGVYLNEGTYLLDVDSLKLKTSRKNDELFIAEFDILESTSKGGMRLAGTSASWVANLTKHDAAPGNVKAFLAALAGVPHDKVDTEGSKAAVSEKQPFHGRLIRCECTLIQTREKKDFTKHSFTTVPDAVQQKRGELRQKAGFKS